MTAQTEHTGVVLVVDDSATNRQKMSFAVRNLGQEVVTAENGEEALDRLKEGGVDLVLLDIVMPGIDGYEVLRRMMADEDLREIPVLVISSLEEMSDAVTAIELGATDFLTKNFDPVLLRARVNTCLDRKRLRDMELDYLRQVRRVAEAARILETSDFDPGQLGLEGVAGRPDSLGNLARVFLDMAQEVHRREQAFRRQISLLKGSFLLLLIGLGWGLIPALSRLMMADVDGSIGAAAWVLTGNAVLMVLICLVRGQLPKFTASRVRFALVLGLIGTVLPQILLFAVAEHVPAIMIAIALAMESIFVFVLAGLIGVEAPSLRRFVGLLFGLACVGLLVVPEQDMPGLSDPMWMLAAFAVPFLYGLEGILIMTWPDPEEDPIVLVTLLMIASTVIVWPIAYAYGEVMPILDLLRVSGPLIPAISIISCVVTVVLVIAIRHTGAVFASQSAYAIAIAGVVWGMLLLNETPSSWVWAGLACMLSGLVLVRPRDEEEPPNAVEQS